MVSFVILVLICLLSNIFIIKKLERYEEYSSEQVNMEIESEDGYKYCILERDTGESIVSILKYTGSEIEIEVPENIDGYKVAFIESACFAYNENIEKVIIPETVEYMGPSVFGGCKKLNYVRMPESIEEAGQGLFLDTSDELVVYCKENSYMHTYVQDQNYSFELY